MLSRKLKIHLKRLAESRIGNHISKEHKLKISKANKGNKKLIKSLTGRCLQNFIF